MYITHILYLLFFQKCNQEFIIISFGMLLMLEVWGLYNGGGRRIEKCRTQSNDTKTTLYLALTIYIP
jgi:hypothetical protein